MTKYTEIIDKYLDGEMSPQEALTFEQQIKTNPDLAYEVRLHQLAIAGVQHSEESRFQEFKSRMKAIESDEKDETPVVRLNPKRSGAVRWAMRIAAVLVPLLFLYFLFPFSGNKNNPLAATTIQLVELHTTSSRGDAPSPQTTLLDEAIQSFQQKDYQAAIASFDQIIKTNPDQRATALYLKADALYRLGKKTEARNTLKKVLNEDDDALKTKVREVLDKL